MGGTTAQKTNKERIEDLESQTSQIGGIVDGVAQLIECVDALEGGIQVTKIRVPEPRAYGGARDAKELENFLFDMEQYFRAVKPDSEETKVSMATMYLTGDAKLWWRTKYDDIVNWRCTIDGHCLGNAMYGLGFRVNRFHAARILLQLEAKALCFGPCHKVLGGPCVYHGTGGPAIDLKVNIH